ncbi:MAG: hypothetical protein COX77_04715 [Candidatus Komeilibacteria bacterium CG_4_10_14_0_2_um_filter_37_10]|uniref:Uncharacterized protein n=1 Tax=Candidatus Komeilibacteria bacterium CG_4_10_14_0_2_um_filter_37_10 TaxID=1974470 RepID=A0A2M7VDB5_9BACT|nr:MAG: hypothetical protein COX77_04715 [Candidatus Komeilibacteria bacterium CG_4_10_14_0_2_um_filter_37_10]
MSLPNNQTKIVFFTFVIIPSIILIGIIVYLFFLSRDNTITNEDIVIPRQGDRLLLNTEQGGVAIDNIYQLAGPDLPQKGTLFAENKNYSMSYYPFDQGFIINLLNPNLNFARQRAEEDLLKYLGISKEEVCRLKIMVNTTYSISKEYSGRNLGLSFCPNSQTIQ